MFDNELFVNKNNNLELKDIIVRDIVPINEYTFFELDNEQKFLTDGVNVYDVSLYDNVLDIFTMGNRICAVVNSFGILAIIDLKTMEELFKDKNAYNIIKQDERTIKVMMHIGSKNDTIYDIKTKKYLPIPEDYEFEHSLGNGLYVFVEKDNFDKEIENKEFYDLKRCIINTDGKILLKDIEGFIHLNDNYLIIIKDDSISIIGINEDEELNIKTIEKNKNIIAEPKYYKGNIVMIEENTVKIFSPSLLLLNEIKVDDLKEILDLQITDDTLKLLVPYMINDRQVNKHIFVNLNNGNVISNVRIESLPYWVPNIYIGKDDVDTDMKDFYFYNRDFDLIRKVYANSYESVDSDKENIFLIDKMIDTGIKKQLFNTDTNVIKDVDYGYVQYRHNLPYGYGINFEKEIIDFLNEDFNIIFPNLEYKKYDLDFYKGGFGYFIINDYICIKKNFTDGYGYSQYRTIVIKNTGEVILDSYNNRCYAIGDAIQIIENGESKFLNTRTGDIGVLKLHGPVNEDGKIDFRKLTDFNSSFKIDCCENLSIGESFSKVKRLEINEWIDNYL